MGLEQHRRRSCWDPPTYSPARPPARPAALAVAKVYKGLEGGLTVLNGQGVTADRAEAMRRLEEDESTGWNPEQPMESALRSRRLDRPLARKRVRRMVELFRRIVRLVAVLRGRNLGE